MCSVVFCCWGSLWNLRRDWFVLQTSFKVPKCLRIGFCKKAVISRLIHYRGYSTWRLTNDRWLRSTNPQNYPGAVSHTLHLLYDSLKTESKARVEHHGDFESFQTNLYGSYKAVFITTRIWIRPSSLSQIHLWRVFYLRIPEFFSEIVSAKRVSSPQHLLMCCWRLGTCVKWSSSKGIYNAID